MKNTWPLPVLAITWAIDLYFFFAVAWWAGILSYFALAFLQWLWYQVFPQS